MDNKPRILFCVLLLAGYGKSTPTDFSRFGESSDSCSNLQFRCQNGQCIPQYRLCDGHADCSDKSDETRETCKDMRCSPYSFSCNYGACVDGDATCNGIKDCVDNSDETLPTCSRNSSSSSECSTNHFKCKNGQCIDSTSLCDGIVDCSDVSDETAIACGSFPCDAYVFRCAYGACIDVDLRCNGAINCADGSDEDPSLCVKGSTSRPNTSRPTSYRPTTQRQTQRQTQRPTQRTTQRPTQSYPRPTQPFTQRPSTTEITCPVPRQPENGQYKLYKSHCASREHCDVNPRVQSLEKGSQLVYGCNSGYKMKGNVDVLCGPDGKWLHIPQCIEIRCEALSSASRNAECTYHNKDISCYDSVPPFTTAELSCSQSYHPIQSEFSVNPTKYRVACNETGHWTPDPIQCVADCGLIVASNATTFIVNGQTAKVSEFPWHATLYKEDVGSGEKKFICGASIIREDLLITAAHCVYEENTGRPYPASLFYVATGNVIQDYETSSPYTKKRKVKNVYVICSFKGAQGLYANDIALLEIEKPFTLSALLMPVCLDPNAYNEDLTPGSLGKVAGFGRTETGSTSYILRMITVPYVSKDVCESGASETNNVRFITADKFCAGYTNGSSVCDGDSGGGLVFKKRELYFLRGIVSLGLGAQKNSADRTCNSFTYSLYTQVAEGNLKWIQKVILKLQTDGYYPPCYTDRDD